MRLKCPSTSAAERRNTRKPWLPLLFQTSCCVDAQGKLLMLITNSDYQYTDKMMSFAYDEFLPPGKSWRDLFDMVSLLVYNEAATFAEGRSESVGLLSSLQVIIQARKPDFFEHQGMSLFEIVSLISSCWPQTAYLSAAALPADIGRWQSFRFACRQAPYNLSALLRSQRMG